MVKTATQIQDIDTSLEFSTSSFTYLPKIAAPYTTVVNRAQVTDFAADGLPKFGVERIMTQQLIEVQGEVGPSGERVFKPLNDIHDQVRFVGGFGSAVDAIGQYAQTPNSDSSSFIEVTFYGTGLNALVGFNTTANRSLNISLDGGGIVNVPFAGTTGSSVLNSRNYSVNMIFNLVSNLSLGMHTVKISGNGTASQIFNGFEVVNTASTIFLPTAQSFIGGKRAYKASTSTTAYNSGFTNTYGTLSVPNRGGHVLVYQKSDGTITKDIRYTETAPAYLASASHTNEEVIRRYNFREFGAGRTDDFSSLTSTASPRAFTLDDGTTSLVVSSGVANAPIASGPEGFYSNGANSFFTFTFVGTGLDLVYAATGSNLDIHTFTVDGNNVGSISGSNTTSAKVLKIASGLPYGTHTVRVTNTQFVNNLIAAMQFIVYVPKKPTLPSGAVELSNYFLMADFVANATAGLETVATGVLRKNATREMIYTNPSGSYAIGFDPALYVSAQQVTASVSGSTVKYTFFGTGFELRGRANTVFSGNITLSIDGSANWSSFTSSAYGGFSIVNSTTGQISQAVSNTLGSGIRISGLTLGLHTVLLTNNVASSYVIEALDIITPVHCHREIGPARLQNTSLIGSCALGDLRKFAASQVPESKAWCQAIGVTSGPNTTSTTVVPMTDMSVSLSLLKSSQVQISYNATMTPTGAGSSVTSILYVNGQQIGTDKRADAGSATSPQIPASDLYVLDLMPGSYKIDVYWRTNGTGTANSNGTARNLTARVI